jgi:3'(2'), 5'-bisphosphate nucleotidase
MRKLDYEQLLEDIAIAAAEAGEAILKIVEGGFAVESKDDLSPVTIADRAAELIILAALAKAAPGVPVVAEEEVAAGRIPDFDDFYFLVDPLDGTREFVRGGEDYTVNIGLISGNSPLLGVVFAPALGTIYGGTAGKGAWIEDSRGRRPIRARERGQKIAPMRSGNATMSVSVRR